MPRSTPRLSRAPAASGKAPPAAAPVRSVSSALGYAPHQSHTHSHTFPCMSYRPQSFGSSRPASRVMLFEFLLVRAQSSMSASVSPKLHCVAVPASAANSHSASVARRKPPALQFTVAASQA